MTLERRIVELEEYLQADFVQSNCIEKKYLPIPLLNHPGVDILGESEVGHYLDADSVGVGPGLHVVVLHGALRATAT